MVTGVVGGGGGGGRGGEEGRCQNPYHKEGQRAEIYT
jgi:hypothetical protein